MTQDTVIYVFRQAGNKKISNLNMLYPKAPRGKHMLWHLPLIMHDQEPLKFELYQDLQATEIRSWLLAREAWPGASSDMMADLADLLCHENLRFAVSLETLYDKILLCHSELNSDQVQRYQDLGMVPVYWWSHAMIARDWYRYAAVDPELCFRDPCFDLDYNIYNRAWSGTREYRLKFCEMLVQHDLHTRSNLKFNSVDHGCHYLDHQFHNKAFDTRMDFSMLDHNDATPDCSADYSNHDYRQCAIDVVLETLFDDTRVHLTEKILRPIACGKPFILVGTPGSLAVLRDYGFRTFGDLIDESYDLVVDPVERMTKIVKVMHDLSLRPDRQQLIDRMHQVSQHNRDWFWSQTFADRVLAEFRHNYSQALTHCETASHGQRWRQLRRDLHRKNPRWRDQLLTRQIDRVQLCDIMQQVTQT